ncbi:TRAP transporter small permease [Silicimonas algicola]|uniref:TRAP transporter small permease protein n=1 Tax=Silicimonas algicola TaxID=1826607 RepID=A0A316GK22_9RHOB|nr:TRAP transporter small permease [Silicimonas algicola]AZQ66918.1 TRAP transporter small permease [Silicimonas algicola]PWK55167.1 C4-dicarboxylate transporter DctQ subunit [Silicimonas algicola]
MSGQTDAAVSPLGRFVNALEEMVIAYILAAMTVITFVNVVLRYVFNHTILWGLEVTTILFAWLVLLGISYGFKRTAHLGVDAILNIVGPGPKRVMVLLSALACLVYGGLLMKGAWDYWAPFAGYQRTEGRIIPTGFDDRTRDQAFYHTEQVPVPFGGEFLAERFNMGESYDKLPRFIPYFVLPFGVALMLFRIIQATIGVLAGRRDSLIVSHEAEDAVAEARMAEN